ncbi:hypothetical protein EQM13_09940 [Acidilutibacter cellobiosedens]|jgi:ABC-type transport system involved in multi-copper enzyme maturation permease subunit|uniref:ABC-2 family transporter protein n=1 Tax=Acidilutibacter cellobiosedens TaxID=2507161 RepID=A0A410QD24_9FIRM|nr:ABC transporter permease subunit [Acidilutibacter cellobiosedens]QAT61891.1 hypothetical protein EQM13_09940 [Acidilutibacter cellobiosedens]
MNIRINEFKKVITSPIIIGLLILFIIFNSTIIFKSSYIKEDLEVLNKIVNKFGYKIDDKMISGFKSYYDKGLKRLNILVNERESKNYNSVSEFYDDHNYGIEDIYDKEEIEFIRELGIVEAYYYKIGEIDDVYSNIDIMEKAENEISKYGLKGEAANTVRNEYRDFNKRFHQLVNNKEHKNLFYIGQIYRMHSLLFKSLFKSIIFEIIILTVLITSYLINYEFENNTEAITYTTRRGRNFILDKISAAIVSSILATGIILITGLGLYFMTFDYSRLWNVPISSCFNADYDFVYMSWWNMSFVQYLFAGIGVIFACMLLFIGITFIIARAIKNNYIVFVIFAIIFGLFLIVPGMAPRNSNAIFIGGFTPFFLIMNPFIWFMESGAFTTFKYYELATVGIWSVLLLILGTLSINRFKKQDIAR